MKKTVSITLAGIFLVIALFSGYQLWRYSADEQQTENLFDHLSARVERPPDTSPEPGSEDTAWTVNDQYGPLFEQNPDMIGWIAIDGTGIDYPVMQTPDTPNYYINHNFEKLRSKSGVPYAVEGSKIDPQSDNITIYGHHMRSGKMFAALGKYKDKNFYLEHPVIRFDTRAGFGTYEIIAAFKTTLANFPFHLFIDASNEAAFDEYISRCKELACYDTGIDAKYGDKLISLSTCEYSQNDGRLVVVAKKIAEKAADDAKYMEVFRNIRLFPLIPFQRMNCLLPLRIGR